MRKLHCFLFLLLFSSVNLFGQSSAQTSQGTYIKVHFKKQGSALFTYSGKNYRNTEIDIINKKKGDTIIVKHIELDKPTVFKGAVMLKSNQLMIYKYIGLNQRDTISLEVTDSVYYYTGNDNCKMIFNEMFGASDYKSSFAKTYLIADYYHIKVAVENEKSDRLKRLIAFIK